MMISWPHQKAAANVMSKLVWGSSLLYLEILPTTPLPLTSIWDSCEDEALGGWWQYSLCMGKRVMLQGVRRKVKNTHCCY